MSDIYNLIHSYDDAIAAAKPGSPEADRLIQNQRQTIEQLPGLTTPSFGSTGSGLADFADEAKARNDGYQETHNNAIVPPETIAAAKAGKIQDNDLVKIKALYEQGITPQTDPVGYLRALGAASDQNGLLFRTTGIPLLDNLANAFSSKRNALVQRQHALMATGQAWADANQQLQIQQLAAPKTMEQANSIVPGLIQPLSNQHLGAQLGPNDQGPIAPYDPKAPLLPFQQAVALQAGGALAKGELMNTPEGIVPANYATYNGRYMMDPMDAVAAVKQATGMDIQPPSKPVPATVINSMISNISAGSRQDQRLDRPTLDKDVNALAMSMHGQPFYDLSQPQQQQVLDAARARTKDMRQFENDQYINRSLALAGPVARIQTTARNEAERDQPVAEPQLWRNKDTGEAAPASLTTRQAQDGDYVKVRPDQVETINQYATIDDGLREVKDIAKRLFSPKKKTAMGEAWRSMTQAAKLAFLRATGDEDMLKMDSIITRLTAPLVKSQGDTANIAVAEREMFKQALVNNRASTEAVLANLDNVIKTSDQVRKSMGFRVLHPDWKQGNAGPGKVPTQSAESRFNELSKSGMKDDAIYKQLHKEGYR